ncbi:MAG: PfkB family carbohydrate kinase [Burkholderiaceae bacterium]
MTRSDPMLCDRLRAHLLAPRPAEVVCVGHTTWDMTWRVDALPAGGGKQRASGYRDGGGGMAATAAVAIARLGGLARFWGRAGDDTAGVAMRTELAAAGVDVEGLRLAPGARSSVSAILVESGGERRIVNFRGDALPEDPGGMPLERIATAGAVLADPRWPAGAQAAFEAARAAGVPTVLDGDVAERELIDSLLAQADIVIFSEPGLAGYVPELSDPMAGLAHARDRGCRVAALTQGPAGVTWSDAGGITHLPAHSIIALDTTGAGDVFHGAFALAVSAGLAVADAMAFANAAAALKCQYRGTRDGCPDLRAVLAMLA